MTLDVVCFIFGAILLGLSILGEITGQFVVKPLERWLRILAAVAGLAFIITAIFLFLRKESTTVSQPPTVTPTEVVEGPSAVPPEPSVTATSEPPSPTVTAVTETPTPTATIEPTPPPTPTEGVDIPILPTIEPNDIVIAVPVPLSGEQAGRGWSIVKSILLALEDYADDLASEGLSVKLLPIDDRSDADLGASNAQAIIDNPQVRCVVGHNRSDVLRSALPIYNNAPDKVGVISVGATNKDLTIGPDNSNRVLFRVVGRDDVQAQVAADFIGVDLAAAVKRIVLIYDDTDYGRGLRDSFTQALTKYPSIEIVNQPYAYRSAETDEQPIVNIVTGEEPDLVFFAGYYNQAGPIIKLIVEKRRAQGRAPPIIFGTDGLDNPEIVDLIGPAMPDTFYYTTVAMPRPEYDQINSNIDDRYVAKYGEAVPAFLAESYDAASICLSALLEAKAAPTRAAILSILQSYSEGQVFPGVSGNYRFTPQGDPTQAFYYARQVPLTVQRSTWAENPVRKKISAGPSATPQ